MSSLRTSVVAPPLPSRPQALKGSNLPRGNYSRSPVGRKCGRGTVLDVRELRFWNRKEIVTAARLSLLRSAPPTVCSCAFRGIENVSVIVLFFFKLWEKMRENMIGGRSRAPGRITSFAWSWVDADLITTTKSRQSYHRKQLLNPLPLALARFLSLPLQ